jgi:hypothetical protein
MKDDPCKNERDTFEAATEELIDAGNAYFNILPSGCLDTGSTIAIPDWKEQEALTQAIARIQASQEKYFAALKTLSNCEGQEGELS